MGMRRDMMQHQTVARVDDVNRRNRVAAAREIIYEKNYAVDSTAVETLLKKDSLVPTAVCIHSTHLCVSLAIVFVCFRTHFQLNWHNSPFACFSCSLLILCTSLSWASGKRFLSIFCVSWTA